MGFQMTLQIVLSKILNIALEKKTIVFQRVIALGRYV